MTNDLGHWDYEQNKWISADPAPSASTTEHPAIPAVNQEVNIEDQTMLQAFFAKLASKVVEASDLAKRVADLEGRLADAQAAINNIDRALIEERRAHEETRKSLQEVRTQLDHEQRAVHDLVMERDIVVEERNVAQAERNMARGDCERLIRERDEVSRILEGETHRCHVLEERCTAMTNGVNALKAAINGLHSL